MKLKCVLVLSIFAVLSGCVASQEDVRGVYGRQARLEARVAQLSQEVEAQKTQSANNSDLRKQIAQIEQGLKDMQQSISDIGERLSKLEKGGEQVSSFPSQPETPAAAGSEAAPPTVSNEETVFNDGYKSLTEGRYKDARDRFKLFLSKYPSSAKAPDAQYWLAESYYREGNFEEAILAFQRFIDTYPKDSRVPLSYLKQGLSLISIGRKEEARLFLQTLIDKFPRSQEAKVAREKLAALGEGKR
ncbi:MAG: tol-pal system protein YbgF [Ignavibacteriales bacterium]